jgi:hypothetical protein
VNSCDWWPLSITKISSNVALIYYILMGYRRAFCVAIANEFALVAKRCFKWEAITNQVKIINIKQTKNSFRSSSWFFLTHQFQSVYVLIIFDDWRKLIDKTNNIRTWGAGCSKGMGSYSVSFFQFFISLRVKITTDQI